MKFLIMVILGLIFARPSFSQTCEESTAAYIASQQQGCFATNPDYTCTFTVHPNVYYGQEGLEPQCMCYSNVFGTLGYGSLGWAKFCSAANARATVTAGRIDRPVNRCGSIVQIENQVVGEAVPISGTSFTMNYFTLWSQGRNAEYSLRIPIALNPVRDDISSFDITVKDGATVLDSTTFINNVTDVNYSYVWNGLDSSSNPTLGTRQLDVTVVEHHPSMTIPVLTSVKIGSLKSKVLGLGGWLPSIYRFYDVNSKKMFLGDGSTRSVIAKSWNTTGFMVAEENGIEVYYFDSTGRHVYTKSGFLGTTIFTFNYDSQGRLSSIVEPFGRSTSFNRNSSGDFVSITAPKGQVTSVVIDSNGYLSSITNPNSETYSVTYSGVHGLIQSFTKPGGQVSYFSFDSDGNLTQDAHSGGYFFDIIKNNGYYKLDYTMTSKMGRSTNYQGSAIDSNISRTTTHPDARTETYNYSQYNGNTSESISSNGFNISMDYSSDARFGDHARFLTSKSVNYGNAYYYMGRSQSVTLTNPSDPFSISNYVIQSFKGAFTTSTSYAPSTKTFTTTTGLGRTMETAIDTYERVISKKRGTLYPFEFTYTSENLTKLKQNARETNLTYNSSTGFLTSITNPLNESTTFTYDNAGRVTSMLLPDLRVVGYGYDANGRLTGITPPNRPMHSFNFNSSELMNAYAPPTLSGISTVNTSYAYNDDKQLTQITKPTGDTVNYTYSSGTGALQNFTTPGGTFYLSLDYSTSLPSMITSPGGRYTYISYAGTIPVQYRNSDSAYSYSDAYKANLTSIGTLGSDVVETKSDSSTINYTYDNDEALLTAGDVTLAYNLPTGLVTDVTLGSGTTGFSDLYTYNSFGEVTAYTAKRGPSTLYTLTLGRDATGRVNSKSEFMNALTNSFDYTFDSAGRLTQTDKNSVTAATYGYDDNSNRNSGSIGAQTTIATYNAQDWMTAYNALTFTYNANGDMLTKTNTITNTTTTYTYDVFGNLTSVALPGGTTIITYEIDGLNRRIGKLINGILQKRWVYMDQTRIAAEVTGAGTISKRFVYGSKSNIPDYMIMNGVNYRIISDHLGSPRLVVKQSDGSIAQRMNHDEYGRVTEDTNPGFLPFGFAGGLYDEQTSLVRFGARDYDPETGRWTSKDPIGFGGGDTNLFGYVANDPVNNFDPTGLTCQYSQSSGTTICSNMDGVPYMVNTGGYSGNGAGKNNPAMQGTPNVGPIPQGSYTAGQTVPRTPNGLINAIPLTPNVGTNTLGRNGFFIHGENQSKPPGTSSNGCPIIGPDNRSQIPSGETFNVGP